MNVALQVLLLLAAALAGGRAAAALRLPTVVGQLLGGLALGPSVLGALAPGLNEGLFAQTDHLRGITQVAVIVLVGLSAMEMSPGLLRSQSRKIGLIVVPSFTLPMIVGVSIGLWLLPSGLMAGIDQPRWRLALLLGAVLAVSALPVAVKLVEELGVHRQAWSQTTMAAVVAMDALVWVVVAVAIGADMPSRTALGLLLCLAAVLPSVWLVRRRARVGRVAEHATGAPPSRAAAPVLLVLLWGAAVSGLLGFDVVLGAFLAGTFAARSRRDHRAEIEHLEDVTTRFLAPLAFGGMGLSVDLTALTPATAAAAAVLIVAAVAAKLAGGFAGGRLAGFGRAESWAIGSLLTARGAMEIVLADLALRAGLLDARWHAIVMAIAVATSILAVPLARVAIGSAGTRLTAAAPPPGPPSQAMQCEDVPFGPAREENRHDIDRAA